MGWIVAGWLICGLVHAGTRPEPFHTRVKLLCENETVAPGDSFDVGILLRMDPGWHTYGNPPGDAGLATSVKWELPAGFEASPLRWPRPEEFKEGELTVYGYHDEVLLLSRIRVPAQDYANGRVVRLDARVEWLECKNLCVPGTATVSTTVRIGESRPTRSAEVVALFEKYRRRIPPDGGPPPVALAKGTDTVRGEASLWQMLLAGFIGGLILNLMPCVLPVVAIKVLGFLRESQEGASPRTSALVYSAGVLCSFGGLASLVAGLRAGGEQVGWGFQFQNPYFLMAMALVTTVVALNFFGVFEIQLPSRALTSAAKLAGRTGMTGAFFNGVLTTLLATPCTAPFLAPAIGFAFSRSATVIFLVCTAIGVGLAAPYVVLTWHPPFLKWLPKPGAWLNRFRQTMGFPLLATTIWLLWILDRSFGSEVAWPVSLWLLFVALAIWLVAILAPGRFTPLLGAVLLVTLVAWRPVSARVSAAGGRSWPVAAPSGLEWQPFSKAGLQVALRTSRPVFIDFTADWCLTCQVNRRSSLDDPRVAQRFRELKVLPLLADWTRRDDEVADALRQFGRAGVPLYVIYPANRTRPPILLPEILTPSIVLDALNRAVGEQ
jgi:thiol:disulfide interchange protein